MPGLGTILTLVAAVIGFFTKKPDDGRLQVYETLSDKLERANAAQSSEPLTRTELETKLDSLAK